MRRAATQLAHRASARFVPATTSTSAWVPVTEGTGSPGQRWGMGDESGGGALAASAPGGGRPPHPRLAGGHTFASSSSFATATAATAKEPGATTIGPPPDVETVNALFIEAREELEYAAEDAGTTYAAESYAAAVEAVDAAGRAYAAFIAGMPEEARAAARRGMGMKFEQLKAELEAVEPGH